MHGELVAEVDRPASGILDVHVATLVDARNNGRFDAGAKHCR